MFDDDSNAEDRQAVVLDADGRPVGGDEETSLVDVVQEIPDNIFIVPVHEPILFPGMTLPLVFAEGMARSAMEHAAEQSHVVGFLPWLEQDEEWREDTPLNLARLSRVGVLARLLRTLNLPDGNKSFLVACTSRFTIVRLVRPQPPPVARVEHIIESLVEGPEFEGTWRAAKQTLRELVNEIPNLPEQFSMAAVNIEGPSQLTDFVGAHLDLKREQRLALLAELDIARRLRLVVELLVTELEMVRLASRIRDEIRQKVEKAQKEYYLREQLKAIRKELGEEVDQREMALKEMREKIAAQKYPDRTMKRIEEEMRRFEVLSPDSPEHAVVRNYLDWLTDLPWSRQTEDNKDIVRAHKILDEDHYGLEEVKKRILEYLAVRKLKPGVQGAILCFAGPPGVGKTSLGQSIARALDRKFFRFSLGGMRDEAEVKGHRRTYIGAMPGKILQGLKYVDVRNPVFMLDEIDKLGSDWRGDPSSAMLEVLDPEQNSGFLDHYLDVPFDLSHVMFICTANVKANIPPPLLDRMEIIDLPGYIVEEKVEIAARYLLPRQRERHGLRTNQLQLAKRTIGPLISGWTAEAGVRELERKIGQICRKVAAGVAAGKIKKARITGKTLPDYLGPVEYTSEVLRRPLIPGVTVGLAWTPVGGQIMFIEGSRSPGKGVFRVTGQLGAVMEESTSIALSYVRAHADEFQVQIDQLERSDIHVHFPAGAVPKDGPSAGIAITTCLVSLLGWKGKGRKIKRRLAMTGEMTLRGDVMPVGGIREKMLGAKRAGVREIILPAENRRNVEQIPKHIVKGLTFHYAEHYSDVFRIAFPSMKAPAPGRRTKRKAGAKRTVKKKRT
ncbi:MAG: endopeptidase La [Deltaproteobacteria bacterium]|nr:endopeptidase La [Deltaproteobacteria bacterium]